MRRQHAQESAELGGEPVAVGDVRDDDAGGVPVRVYEPTQDRGGVVVYLHGGGWVVGGSGSYDRLARRLAEAAQATLVNVDYRLAPEHAFPAALDDVDTVLRWAGSRLPGSAIALAGDSAGANLATVAARRARDGRGGLPIAFQALVYPVCDARRDTASYRAYDHEPLLRAEAMEWYFEQYGGDPDDPSVSPLRTESLAGLPPALVLVAGHDVLRDEGEAYAERLSEDGVPVELVVVEGAVHGFLRWTADVELARACVGRVGRALRAGLDGRAVSRPGT